MAAIIIGTSGDFPINNFDDAINNPIGKWLYEYLPIPKDWLDVSISISLSIIFAISTGFILLRLYKLKALKIAI
jgi:hypothetical protein